MVRNHHINTELIDLLEELATEGYVSEGTPHFEVAQKVIVQGKVPLIKKRYLYSKMKSCRPSVLSLTTGSDPAQTELCKPVKPMNDRDSTRRANLLTILRELAWEGVETIQEQAKLLGTTAKDLHAFVMEKSMPDSRAREIEWAAHKPDRWMDLDQIDLHDR